VLTLACLDSVQSCTEEDLKKSPESTCNECPAGFHKVKGTFKCRKCIAGKGYTAIPNNSSTCLRCTTCDEGVSQMVVKSCEPKNDIKCGCMKGHYPKSSNHGSRCIKCQTLFKVYRMSHLLHHYYNSETPKLDTQPQHHSNRSRPFVDGGYMAVVRPLKRTSSCLQGTHQPTTDAKDLCLSAVPSKTLNITEGIPMTTFSHSAAKTEYYTLVTPLLPGREPR
ncbi:unnamed protein product, partial [Coregonus sp. 'balchen']